MTSSITFARVRGIPIGAHWSWIVVFGVVVLTLAQTILPAQYPGLGDATYVAMAVAAAIAFFASIVLHELGHALVAIREDMTIEGITLWVFGGVARLKGAFRTPAAELKVAIAGPLVSGLLVGVFGAAAWAGRSLGVLEAVTGVLAYLARINAILVGFNLVPALPLDGGRVLRAYLWRRTGSLGAATAWAARAGSAFGLLLTAIGVLGLLSGGRDGGLWLVFLGWFLTGAARAERDAARTTEALEGRVASDAMTASPETVAAGTGLATFFATTVGERGHRAYPVISGGRFTGLISLAAAGAVPPERRPLTTVDDVMERDAATASPATPLRDVAEVLAESRCVTIVDGAGAVAGVISASDLRRLAATSAARRSEAGPPRRRVGIATYAIVVAAMAVAAGALYYPPLYVLVPGEAIDVTRDIHISGVPVERPSGRYLLTSVRIESTNALGVLVAAFRRDSGVLRASAIAPPGVDPHRFESEQRALFRQSRVIAAAAAARAAGLEVGVRGNGAVVRGLLPGSPAARVLRPGDVIKSIDGKRITTTQDVSDAIRAQAAGTRFVVEVKRAEQTRRFEIRSARIPQAEGPAIGVEIVNSNLHVDLPFDITFTRRPIGGPSAGLAFALAITDMLDHDDHARGRTIAVTGTIDPRGSVGMVGGVPAKTVAAEHAGATLLLVPEDQVAAAEGEGLPVRGVATLDEALDVLDARSS